MSAGLRGPGVSFFGSVTTTRLVELSVGMGIGVVIEAPWTGFAFASPDIAGVGLKTCESNDKGKARKKI